MKENTATIWKFPIPISDEFSIQMPQGAELLFVDAQFDEGYLWARVVPERRKEERFFALRGTGHPMDMDSKHIGSFIIRNGEFVFHLFEHVPGARGSEQMD